MSKLKRILPYLILYILVIIGLIILLSFKMYYASLLCMISAIFDLPIIFVFFLLEKKSFKKKIIFYFISYSRLLFLILGTLIPALLWYYVISIKEVTSPLFLLSGTIIAAIIYAIYIIDAIKNKEKENK